MASENVKYLATVQIDSDVKVEPKSDSDTITTLSSGTNIKITYLSNGWGYAYDQKGWILINDALNDKVYVEITDDSSATTKSSTNTTTTTSDGTITTTPTEGDISTSDVPTFTTGTESYINDVTSSLLTKATLRGIHGLPYQYSSMVDPKLKDSVFGRKYAEKMIANMPMLLITPGSPKFMKGYSVGDKKSLLKGLIDNNNDTITELLNTKNGKFYSFEFNYLEYYKIVTPMCNKVALMLGLGDELLDGVKLSKYDWQNYAAGNDALKAFITSKETVAFFIDSESQVQESFSNDTGASSLASTVGGLSDMGREIQFLTGATSGAQFDMMKQENYDASMSQLDNFTSKFSSILPGGLMEKLKDGFLTVATGGKMLFPEIWNDSQFSRSYDITIKLRTPDADKYSIFMNLYVPLLHLIALTGAQQLGANSYKSPFLVRTYYKGFFNIDMGIITSLNITKGDKCKWTLDGLPTQIDISMTIKDLYQTLSLTPDDNILNMIQNTAELDYLSNLCGININKVDIGRSIDIFLNTIGEGVKSTLVTNRFTQVQQNVSNIASSVFKSLGLGR